MSNCLEKSLWELSGMMAMFYILIGEVTKVFIAHGAIHLQSGIYIKYILYFDKKIIVNPQTDPG